RDRKDGSNVANVLFAEQWPFITQDSLYLDHSTTVRFLFSLLRCVDDPANMLARTEVLSTYINLSGYNAGEITACMYADFHSQNESLFDKLIPAAFREGMRELEALPVYELVEELVKIFKLDKEDDAYIMRFLDVSLEYTLGNNTPGVKGFLEWYKNGT